MLIRAENTGRNPKLGPEGPKKGVPRARLVLSGTNVVKKVGMGVQNRAKNDSHASNVLVIGGRPKAAQEHWFGGRPKAAFIGSFRRACVLWAAGGRPCLQLVDPCACV